MKEKPKKVATISIDAYRLGDQVESEISIAGSENSLVFCLVSWLELDPIAEQIVKRSLEIFNDESESD